MSISALRRNRWKNRPKGDRCPKCGSDTLWKHYGKGLYEKVCPQCSYQSGETKQENSDA